ncbi:hypothetical protein GPJ56_000657 [Histomonas meleagridis]|uniref:uncharacterized protein n=1 Tax=Histomonas meleagridis TaxID=135588 RepID=UPI00355A8A90|nr:hypothetical protein GPJ56_000657 [Histomonas meleagridis]KAH0804786.1 hypothetical protein GO595_002480 [Histomonas meleagridis]
MVLVDLVGLVVSSTKVVFQSISNAIKQAVALNAPNGNIFQKFTGAVFGVESTTQMLPIEAKQVLGIEGKASPDQIQNQLNLMLQMNDLSKGGSPYLNERFIAAAHVLMRNPY